MDIETIKEWDEKCNEILIDRKNKYGDIDSEDYIKAGINIKAHRILNDLRIGSIINKDTLIDLVNYCKLYLEKGYCLTPLEIPTSIDNSTYDVWTGKTKDSMLAHIKKLGGGIGKQEFWTPPQGQKPARKKQKERIKK